MSEKGKCFVAYLFGWIGGLIILFGMKDNDKNTKFHAAQSIVLSALYCIIIIVLNMVNIRIGILNTLLGIVYIAGIVLGIIKANNNEEPELPIVGELTKNIFNKQLGE